MFFVMHDFTLDVLTIHTVLLFPRLDIQAARMVFYRTAKFRAHPSISAAVAGGPVAVTWREGLLQ
jgi:hypothetical protein